MYKLMSNLLAEVWYKMSQDKYKVFNTITVIDKKNL